MQNPDPPKPATNWVPHRSIATGNPIGGAIAVLILPFVIPLYPNGVSHDDITIAFTALCTFIATYFIPDNPNRTP